MAVMFYTIFPQLDITNSGLGSKFPPKPSNQHLAIDAVEKW